MYFMCRTVFKSQFYGFASQEYFVNYNVKIAVQLCMRPYKMTLDTIYSQLGRFVLTFQEVEEAMVELIVALNDSDPEYIATLTAELEFTAKARALDIIYTRFAQIHQLSDQSPHPEFHSLVKRIEKLAKRRNELVHSFYLKLIIVDGSVALERKPTRLKPSEGLREQAAEGIGSEQLETEISNMQEILKELEKYRLLAIDVLYPEI
jgi:hypothetical protein